MGDKRFFFMIAVGPGHRGRPVVGRRDVPPAGLSHIASHDRVRASGLRTSAAEATALAPKAVNATTRAGRPSAAANPIPVCQKADDCGPGKRALIGEGRDARRRDRGRPAGKVTARADRERQRVGEAHRKQREPNEGGGRFPQDQRTAEAGSRNDHAPAEYAHRAKRVVRRSPVSRPSAMAEAKTVNPKPAIPGASRLPNQSQSSGRHAPRGLRDEADEKLRQEVEGHDEDHQ